jgi:hypothetical protein
MHEVAGHGGIRQFFGENYHAYNELLDRVWNGMQNGAGEQIAAQFGTNIAGLAKQYGIDLSTVAGSRRMAEELMARDAENYSPRDLSKLPGYLQKAINRIRDGLSQRMGLEFSRTDTLGILREAWKGREAQRTAESKAALTSKRMAKSYENPNARDDRKFESETEKLAAAASATTPDRQNVRPTAGLPNSQADIRASSDRLRAESSRLGNQHTSRSLQQRAPAAIEGSSVDVRFPRLPATSDFVLRVTRPDGVSGPYGPAPSLPVVQPSPTGEPAVGSFATNSATGDQYLRSLSLSNELFDTGHQLDGVVLDTAQVVSRIAKPEDFRGATVQEIAHFMAARGFHPIDDETYYNPERGVLVLEANSGTTILEGETGKIRPVDAAVFEVEGQLKTQLDNTLTKAVEERLGAVPETGEIRAQLEASQPEIISPEVEAQLQTQMARDEAELAQLRAKREQGTITPQEEARMDAIEYGPLLNKDINEELGPGSPDEPPNEILKRSQESIERMAPGVQDIRRHAMRRVLDEKESEQARLFNASPDQLVRSKGGRKFWDSISQKYRDAYEARGAGGMNGLMEDLITGKLGDEPEIPTVYSAIKEEIARRRVEAVREGDQGRVNQLDGTRNLLDAWFNVEATRIGSWLSNWGDQVRSQQGLMDRFNSDYQKQVRKRVGQDPNYQQTVKEVRKATNEATTEALSDPNIKKLIAATQRAQDRQAAKARGGRKEAIEGMIATGKESLPIRYAEAISDELIQRAKAAQLPPQVVAAFQRLAQTVRRNIAGQMREGGIIMTPAEREKISAASSLRDMINNWSYFRQVRDEVVRKSMEEFKGQADIQHAFAQIDDLLEAPFSKAELERYIRQAGVDINDLVKQHRSRTGAVIDSLSDFLLQNSDLTPEQAKLVDKEIGSAIDRLMQAKLQKRFERIIELANGGKPSSQAKAIANKRLLELVHMGAFGDPQVADALGVLFGFDKGYLPEINQALQPLADKLERYKQQGRSGFQTEQVRLDMQRLLANYSKINALQYFASAFQFDLLANVPTHGVAFQNEVLTGGQDLIGLAFATAKNDPVKGAQIYVNALRHAWNGFRKAIPEATVQIQTGIAPRRYAPMEGLQSTEMPTMMPNVFDLGQSERAWRGIGRRIGLESPFAAFGRYAQDLPMKQVLRWTGAFHDLTYGSYSEATAYILSVRQALEDNLPWHEALTQASKIMDDPGGNIKALREQVADEGFTGLKAKVRLNELIAQEMPERTRTEADYWGVHSMNQENPMGALGFFYKLFQRAAAEPGYEWLKFLVPFARSAANLGNQALDNTLFGVWRGTRGAKGYFLGREGELTETPTRRADMTAERYNDLKSVAIARQVTGNLGLASIMLLTKIFPWFQVHGSGPHNPDEKKALRNTGWVPESVQVGNVFLPYETWPSWWGMGMIGNYFDAFRYPHDGVQPSDAVAAWHAAGDSAKIMFDRSYLRGINDVFETVINTARSWDNPDAVQRLFADRLTSAIPVVGWTGFKQAYQQLTGVQYEAHGAGIIARNLPWLGPALGARPQLNALGEPINQGPSVAWVIPTRRFFTNTRDDQVWDFLTKNRLVLHMPKNPKINGEVLDDDKKYDYTVFRGRYLREMIGSQLPYLSSIKDPEQLKKAFDRIQNIAKKQASYDILAGRKPPF